MSIGYLLEGTFADIKRSALIKEPARQTKSEGSLLAMKVSQMLWICPRWAD